MEMVYQDLGDYTRNDSLETNMLMRHSRINGLSAQIKAGMFVKVIPLQPCSKV